MKPAGTKPAAIILCGGESLRMKRPKPWLAFGSETLLQRVVRLVSIAADPIVVVAAENQDLPPLASDIQVARDANPGQGPIQGLLAGLLALPETSDFVYATATDVPFLEHGWITRLVELSDAHDLTIARADNFLHPLAALYRREPTLAAIERQLRANRRRLLDLASILSTKIIDAEEFRSIDPTLQTLRNLNTPADYASALLDEELIEPTRRNSQADSGGVR